MNPTGPFDLPSPQDSVILIVDDVAQNIQVVGSVLREAGYSIMPATSGAAALQRVEKKLPDLVLLDLMMPGMDGLEVVRRLKSAEPTRAIPVIFLTASNEMEHLVQGLRAGAVDYVTKPFNPPELLARVRTHLELKHSRDAIVRYTRALRTLNDEKNEFMGIVAHDLRNPLGAILGYAELLLEDPDLTRAEIADTAGRVRETATRVIEMVRNLLDANRIERGELAPALAPTDLGALVGSVLESQQPRARAKEQTIEGSLPASPARALVDPGLALQVIENLVSNAVKYSPPGRPIRVRVLPSGHVVRCEVHDEGPGLSEEDQRRLFGKFARLSAKPTGGEHSTGLGLSIVKRMVESMQGRVWCQSTLGHGAVFAVEWPAVD